MKKIIVSFIIAACFCSHALTHGLYSANNQYFRPINVGGLIIWINADSPSANGTRPSNGVAVPAFVDRSGNGNTFVQNTGANQPVFTTNVQNGRPAISLDGSAQYMTLANATSNQFSANQSVTVFAAVSNTNPTQARDNFLIAKGFFPNGGWGVFSQQTTGKYAFVFTNVQQFASTNTFGSSTFEIFSVRANASSGSTVFQKNSAGSDTQTGATGSNSNSQQVALGAYGDATNFWPGYIGELVVYNSDIGATKTALLNLYLKNYWGL